MIKLIDDEETTAILIGEIARLVGEIARLTGENASLRWEVKSQQHNIDRLEQRIQYGVNVN